MAGLVCDTHSAIWYLLDDPRLSTAAGYAMEEKGRITAGAMKLMRMAVDQSVFGFRIATFDLAVTDSVARIPHNQVPDMPDRIIAATALPLNLPLVSRDRKIRSSGILTIW